MSKPLRVLMVEDSEDDALLTIRALTKGGYEPVYKRVETAEAMRNALRDQTWDMILCDYRLPQFSGLAAIALLKDTDFDLPLIIVSSTIGEETAADCLRYGARDWVRKSNLSRLVPAIERELKEAESRSKRKRAEEALWESEESFRAVAENAYEGIIVASSTGAYIYANKHSAKITGYSVEELLKMKMQELAHPDELPKLSEILKKRMAGEEVPSRYETVIMHKSGKTVPVEITGAKTFWHGQIASLVIFRDITERKQAEEALRESEANYKDLVENANSIIIKMDQNGILTFVNDYAQKFFGYTWNEIIEKDVNILVPPAESSGRNLKEMADNILRNPDNYKENINENIRKNGERLWISWRNKGIRDSNGNIVGNLAIGQDITDRKRAEETLRRTEENFRRSLDESPLGVGIVSEEGELLYANRRILDFFGYESIEELRETPFTKHYTESSYAEFLDRKEKRRLHADDDSSGYEIDIVRKDGEIRHLQAWRKNILWNSKKHYQVIYLDTTKSKTVEEALRRSEENFRQSFDDSPLGVRIVSAEGETIYVNRAILAIYGFDSLDELKATPPINRYTPESYTEFRIRREKRQQGDDAPSEYTIDIIRKDGKIRHLQVFRKEILWDGEKQFQVLYNDITERKHAEDALRASEGLLRGLFENMTSGAAIYEVINDGSKGSDYIIRDFNVTSLQFEGKRKDEVIGESLFDLRPNIDQYGLIQIFQKVWRTGEPGYFPSRIYIDEEYSNWYENRVFKLPTGEIVAIYDDVTERKRVEEELRTSRSQLRTLYTRLQQIREEERLLVAREIHDEMGGGLTGLKMDLSWLLRKVGDTYPGEARAALIDKLHTANGLIDQMIREVRRISTALRPSVLDDLGLIAALEWQLSEFTSRTGIPHEFSTTCEYVNMGKDTAIAVFRIFQEALTNVVRHSRATKVMVDLREGERSLFGDDNFVLEIRDNGRGITEEEILSPESLGLLGMKERVLAFGGEISLHGQPGGGTVLFLQIPRKQGDIS